MPPPRTAATYRARDGSQHDVLVLTTPAGRWRILDTTETTVVHVETLTGFDDLLSQATALAERLRGRAAGLPRRRAARGPAAAAAPRPAAPRRSRRARPDRTRPGDRGRQHGAGSQWWS